MVLEYMKILVMQAQKHVVKALTEECLLALKEMVAVRCIVFVMDRA